METKYFIIVNGQQVGPMPRQELVYAGLTADTPIWREGLSDWVKASTLPELNDLLNSSYGQPPNYGQQPNYGPQPGYGQRQGYGPQPDVNPQAGQFYGQQPDSFQGNGLPVAHTNWLPWAIVATVLGLVTSCIGMIFGIIGIVNANKANKFYEYGDNIAGDAANSTAKTNTIIALVFAGIGIVASIFIFTTGFMSNSSIWNQL